ncbi:MAG: transporter substrate-binding domain-containing protein, partial [Methylococcales bacterium]|nr:transporter substrate-binding domain-containing protein [Methylococcales bacterium]
MAKLIFQRELFLLFFLLFSQSAFSTEASVFLTSEEQIWLDNHPSIKIGINKNWPPFDFVDKNQTHQGIASEYISLLSDILNIKFEKSDNIDSVTRNDTKTHQFDMFACVSNTKDGYNFLLFPSSYISTDIVIVSRKKQSAFNTLSDLANKTIALPKDPYIHQLLKKQLPTAALLFVQSNQEALQSVSEGKSDAYVGNLAVITHFLSKGLLSNLKIDAHLSSHKTKLGFAVRKDWPILLNILQKGLDVIPEQAHADISNHWISYINKTPATAQLRLSPSEKRWLQSHTNIRMGIDPTWPPIEYIDPITLKYQGIASEYVDYLEKVLSINIPFDPALDWKQVIDLIQQGKIDILPAVSKTPERSKYLNFTRPYLSFPYVIFTRDDAKLVTSIEELIGKVFVVEKNYANHEFLMANFPTIKLMLVDNTEQALTALSLGHAEAYVGNLAATSHIILKTGQTNIKVAAPTPFNNDLAFAVRKDWPELIPIIQKALDNITQKQKNNFKRKWFSIRFEHSINTLLI